METTTAKADEVMIRPVFRIILFEMFSYAVVGLVVTAIVGFTLLAFGYEKVLGFDIEKLSEGFYLVFVFAFIGFLKSLLIINNHSQEVIAGIVFAGDKKLIKQLKEDLNLPPRLIAIIIEMYATKAYGCYVIKSPLKFCLCKSSTIWLRFFRKVSDNYGQIWLRSLGSGTYCPKCLKITYPYDGGM